MCLTISVVTAGVDGFDRGFCEAAFGQDSAGAFVADVDVGFDVFEFFVARAFAECEVDDGANCFGCVAAAPMFSCDPVAEVCARALVVVAEADAADVAVVVTGVNDVVDQVRPSTAMAARRQLVQALVQRTGARQVVMTPVPPMHRFSGLPQPLRWVAGRDAAAHERALAGWAQVQPGVSHLRFDLPLDDPNMLARDGFHPAAPLYRLWGDALAEHIATAVRRGM